MINNVILIYSQFLFSDRIQKANYDSPDSLEKRKTFSCTSRSFWDESAAVIDVAAGSSSAADWIRRINLRASASTRPSRKRSAFKYIWPLGRDQTTSGRRTPVHRRGSASRSNPRSFSDWKLDCMNVYVRHMAAHSLSESAESSPVAAASCAGW